MKRQLWLLGWLLLCMAPALAQSMDCPDIVQQALRAVETGCAAAARNQACFGNVRLEATAQPGVTEFRFEQTGDLVNVASVQSMRLYPLDESAGTWGIVLMRLQANLPDTMPGQNVTFLLFGDVEISSNVPADSTEQTPMQAFYLTTGLGDTQCAEAPQSGLMVQTPQGVGEIAFNVNGVDVSMGSTLLFQAQRGKQMRVRTLEGAAAVRANGVVRPVLAGTQVDIPLDDDLLPEDEPEMPEAYNLDTLTGLPLELFDYEFEIMPPLDDDQLEALWEAIDEGEPLCDDDPETFFPSCDELPLDLGGLPCTLDPAAEPNSPLCILPDDTSETPDASSDDTPPSDTPPTDAPPDDSGGAGGDDGGGEGG
ncbi:MAG: hypothetical protein HXY40_15210 [Chloroflexi bacterium]|nr:hypothetical protein [Chloroflexota bacterium]